MNLFDLNLIPLCLQSTEQIEQQKRQFRNNIEELKSKLHETVSNRDAVIDLR